MTEELKERVLKGLATTLPAIVSTKCNIINSRKKVPDVILTSALFHFMQDVHPVYHMEFGSASNLEHLEMKLPLVAESIMCMLSPEKVDARSKKSRIPVDDASLLDGLVLLRKLGDIGLFALMPDVDNMLTLYAACIAIADRFPVQRWPVSSWKIVFQQASSIHWPKKNDKRWAELLTTVMSWLKWSELGAQDVLLVINGAHQSSPAWSMILNKPSKHATKPILYDWSLGNVGSPLENEGWCGISERFSDDSLRNDSEKHTLVARNIGDLNSSTDLHWERMESQTTQSWSNENLTSESRENKAKEKAKTMTVYAKDKPIIDEAIEISKSAKKKAVKQEPKVSAKKRNSQAKKGTIKSKTPRRIKKEKEEVAEVDKESKGSDSKPFAASKVKTTETKTLKVKKPAALVRLGDANVKPEEKLAPKSARAARAQRRARS